MKAIVLFLSFLLAISTQLFACGCGSGTGSSTCFVGSCTLSSSYDGDIQVTGTLRINADVTGTIRLVGEEARVIFESNATVGGISGSEEELHIRVEDGVTVNVTGALNMNGSSEDGVIRVDSGGVLNVFGGITCSGDGCQTTTTGSGTINASSCELNDCSGVNVDPTLPIVLASFTVEKNNHHLTAKWVTLAEINNDYFTLEQSTDQTVFEPITAIPGAGNSNERLLYTYDFRPDSDVLQYYRLKQTDFDGSYSYSDIVLVAGSSRMNYAYNLQLTSSSLLISNYTLPISSVLVSDPTGRSVSKGIFDESSRIYIDMSCAEKRKMYIVTIYFSDGQRRTSKLIF